MASFDGSSLQQIKTLADTGKLVEATAAAIQICQRFPTEPSGYVLASSLLRRQRKLTRAGQLIERATNLFAADFAVLHEACQVARARDDFEEVIRLAAAMRAVDPDNPDGYRLGLIAYQSLDRDREAAEQLIEEAFARLVWQPWLILASAGIAQKWLDFSLADRRLIRGRLKFPHNRSIALEYAIRPSRAALEQRTRKGVKRSLRRLRRVVELFPNLGAAYGALGEVLCIDGNTAEAEAILAPRVQKPGRTLREAIAWARIAEIEGEAARARERFRRVTRWFPNDPTGFECLAVAAARNGNRVVAMEAVTRASAIAPLAFGPEYAAAKVLELLGDLPAAVERLQRLMVRFPHVPHLRHTAYGLQERLAEQRQELTVAHRGEVAEQGAADPHENPELSTLMMSFQALGGTGMGCEFGLVQRHHGAEPLGLLRWVSIALGPLIEGLKTGFEGLGTEDDLVIEKVWNSSDYEYVLGSRRYPLRIHTFLYAKDIKQDRLRAQMVRRMAFLRRNFLEDLKAGRHIFVRKQQKPLPSITELVALRDAVQSHGPSSVLLVLKESPRHPSGTVEVKLPGLMIGYVDRFRDFDDGSVGSLSAEEWLKICFRAYQLRESGEAPVPLTKEEIFELEVARITEMRQENRLYQGAQAALQLSRQFPDEPAAYLLHSSLLRAQKRKQHAEGFIASVDQQFPGNAEVLEEACQVALMCGDHEAVLRWAAKLRAAHPERKEGYAHAFHIYHMVGDQQAADALLPEAVAYLPLSPWLAIVASGTAQRRVDFEEADRWLMRGRLKFPQNVPLALEYAVRPSRDPNEHQHLRGLERSLRRLRRLINRFPDSRAAYAALGEVLCLAGNTAEAEAVLGPRVEDPARTTRETIAWARIPEFEGDLAAARHRCERVTEWFPQYSTGYHFLAMAAARLGDRKAAEEALIKVRAFAVMEFGPKQAENDVALILSGLQEAADQGQHVIVPFPPVSQSRQISRALDEISATLEATEPSDTELRGAGHSGETNCGEKVVTNLKDWVVPSWDAGAVSNDLAETARTYLRRP